MKQKFDFWKENLVANHFQLTPPELRNKFREWLKLKTYEWVQYYRTERSIQEFIGAKDGLNSVNEPEQFEAIYDLLRPSVVAYLAENKPTSSKE